MSEEPKTCRNCKHWNASATTRERGYDAECEMTIYHGTTKHLGTTAFGKSDPPYYPTASLLTRPNHYCSMHTPLDGMDLEKLREQKRREALVSLRAKYTRDREELGESKILGYAIHTPVSVYNQIEDAYTAVIGALTKELEREA